MNDVKYEIEMLSLGDADAFIINYVKGTDDYLILIDSGNKNDHGKMIGDQIIKYYGKRPIDLAINTHLDQDHISGFAEIIERFVIKEFWIHNPWKHAKVNNRVNEEQKKGSIFYESLNQSKNILHSLKTREENRETILKEPFTGLNYKGFLKVIGPSKEFYKSLLPNFRDFRKHFVFETALTNTPDRSYENNSSTIILFEPIPDKFYLFTGDAGPIAFDDAWTNMPDSIYWLDVPHHGSAKNFDHRLLRLNPNLAYISAENSHLHPDKSVVDKLKGNKCKVYCSSDAPKLHFINSDGRKDRGYIVAKQLEK